MVAHADLRCSYEWGDLDLATVRSLATDFIVARADVPESLKDISSQLMDESQSKYFQYDSIGFVPKNTNIRHAVPTDSCLAKVFSDAEKLGCEIPSLENGSMSLSCSREVRFHWDYTDSEKQAYLIWVLGISSPLYFHSLGKFVEVKVGDIIIFDAQNLHALLDSEKSLFSDYSDDDYSKKMVFGISGVSLNEQLRNKLGIKVESTEILGNSWIEMKEIEYCDLSGCFI